MVDFSDMVDKAKDWAGKNPEKADSYVDKGGDALKERFGGHDEQFDQVGEKAKNYLHPDEGGDVPPPPPGEGPPPPPGEEPPPPPQG